jgi:hypothetical protein
LFLEGAMKVIWIVRWRGLEEQCLSPQEALDRWDQLDARGIEAELLEVVAGQRRRWVMAAASADRGIRPPWSSSPIQQPAHLPLGQI